MMMCSGLNLSAGRVMQKSYAKKIHKKALCCDWGSMFNNTMRDFVDINKAVFGSTDTLKILTWMLPTYLLARSSDENIHECFYEPGLHKNIAQMPKGLHDLSNKGVTVLAITFLALPFFNEVNEDIKETSRLMGTGILSIYGLRTAIKLSLKSRASLRPWNEFYSNTERSLGGFPSGHMGMMSYVSTLYGLRHGAKWGAPLGAFTAFSFVASLNCNRHYASQLVGGLGIGLIYGYASYKVLDSRFGKNVSVSLDSDSSGRPRFNASYEF
jgi:membrane-associated phospholipid phosphatase